ncbi:MAG TPA: tyrosine-type recombinase/integrase [Edaphobacter sp.]|nr:tyrosine-type recombinase/integrase [Edaphobacter sp.]
MATARKIKLDTRSSRRTIPHGPKLHIERIIKGLAIGYRRGLKGGVWFARRHEEGTRYSFEQLGIADDLTDADGVRVLTRDQADAKAREWFTRVNEEGAGIRRKAYTVADAAADWLKSLSEGAAKRNAQSTIKLHILPTLGGVKVKDLRREQLQNWLVALAEKKPIKVQRRENSIKKLSPSRRSKIVYDPNDPETRRKRRDTANRILNDLRAMLNLAYANEHAKNCSAWDNVKKFENVDMPKNEYLTADEANRFIAACPADFRDLVQVALISGCRYGELGILKVNAYDRRDKTISVKQSKTGKLKRIFLADDEAAFFDGLIAGKSNDDLILRRVDGQTWNKSNQQQRMKEVLKEAKIKRHVRFHDLRHTFASLLIQNGASIEVIANQLGHSGTAMAIKHYAHLSPEYIGNTVRANKTSFGLAKAS